MKYTEKNKLQYFEKNNRKNYKIIAKMFPRHFCLTIEIYQYSSDSFYRAFDGASFKKNIQGVITSLS
jgi:hypothetical protein